ncbi:MAG: helix-turn-helix domain-containing protein [Sedimentibacter sp.]|uniref:helix-turn-helix domain-containing protein n=1 Tax=Sedimentibacter sp. TaxID=1960295 RepID=UPI00298235ED|nr:helix-turn-helix domain-containing protein [Sedimentibacter sp.]MDW5299097.1 helix-turn-helix domain-containing protein [Sedimentibacter sp.]
MTTYKKAKQNFEKKYIIQILKSCNNNITHAAKLMEISRRQLFNKIIENDLKDFLN